MAIFYCKTCECLERVLSLLFSLHWSLQIFDRQTSMVVRTKYSSAKTIVELDTLSNKVIDLLYDSAWKGVKVLKIIIQ